MNKEDLLNAAATVIVDEMSDVYQHDGTTLIESLTTLNIFERAVAGKLLLAVDAEGVDLSRIGSMTVFSVGVEMPHGVHVFLFDTIHKDAALQAAQMQVLKSVLEDPNVEKIVHDCRQDSDVLLRQFGISFRCVFDTSIYILEIERSDRRTNLNMALRKYSCPLNANRDAISDLYKKDHAVWRNRPLSPFMLDYASKDVASLFLLRSKLLSVVADTLTLERQEAIRAKSEATLDEFRGMLFHEFVVVPSNKHGCVIGRGGSGIAAIERRTGGKVTGNNRLGFLILASTPAQLRQLKEAIHGSYW